METRGVAVLAAGWSGAALRPVPRAFNPRASRRLRRPLTGRGSAGPRPSGSGSGLGPDRLRLPSSPQREEANMTTNLTEPTTWLLASYQVDGRKRELHAIRVPGEQTLTIIDVLAKPLPEDGDF